MLFYYFICHRGLSGLSGGGTHGAVTSFVQRTCENALPISSRGAIFLLLVLGYIDSHESRVNSFWNWSLVPGNW